jgi:hypothetical protein
MNLRKALQESQLGLAARITPKHNLITIVGRDLIGLREVERNVYIKISNIDGQGYIHGYDDWCPAEEVHHKF